MKQIIFLGLVLLLFSFNAAADDGCFTYPESTLYCTIVPQELAETECNFFEGCTLSTTFNSGLDCRDASLFPECQKIMCKSTCEKTYLGRCSGGAIPQGLEQEWCSPGCCQLSYLGQDHCDVVKTKWECNLQAKNKELSVFRFFSSLSKEECITFCGKEIFLNGVPVTAEEEEIFLPQEVFATTIIPTLRKNITPTESSATTKSEVKKTSQASNNNGSWIWYILITLAIILLGYMMYRSRTMKKNAEELPDLPVSFLDPEKELLARLFPSFFSLQARERLKKQQQAHEHKKREQQRKEFLAEFGLLLNQKEDDFVKLRRVAALHSIKKYDLFRRSMSMDEKKAFERLEELVGTRAIVREDKKEIRNPDVEKVLDDLRKVAGKNKI